MSDPRAFGLVDEQGRLVLRIPRELVSPNTWNGRHWRYKHRLSQIWEQELFYTPVTGSDGRSLLGASLMEWLLARARQSGVPRKRVMVTREVPSARNFLCDDDNLRYTVKPLLDALKRRGFIRNDSRKWIDLPTPEERVSTDGRYWTQIIIEHVPPIPKPARPLKLYPYPCRDCGEPCTVKNGRCRFCAAREIARTRKPAGPREPRTALPRWPHPWKFRSGPNGGPHA